jgi:glycosyltransferase involved in cell wall biosynthesis/UDP-N-acetylglucosamine transferase subunit ALG13
MENVISQRYSLTQKKAKNAEIAVVITNMVQYEAIVPGLTELTKNRIQYDIYVPQTEDVSSGFMQMYDETYDQLKENEFQVYRKPVNKRKYTILLSPYNMDGIIDIFANYRIRFQYGFATKPYWGFRFETNFNYDCILCYSEYDKSFYTSYADARIIGFLKFANYCNTQLSKKKPRKKILYLPTYGPDSSLDSLTEFLAGFQNKYQIAVKLHHGTSYLANEKLRFTKVSQAFNEVYTSKDSLAKIIKDVDIVLSDRSGAIFDSVYLEKPVVVFSNKTDYFHGIPSLLDECIRKKIIAAASKVEDIETVISLGLSKNYARKQHDFRKELFSTLGKDSPKLFMKIINDYLNDNIDMHQSFARKEVYEFIDELRYKKNLADNENRLCKEKIYALRNIVEKQEAHIEKIYSGKVWKMPQLYFYPRDLLVRIYRNPSLVISKVKREYLTLKSHLFFFSSLKKYLPENKELIIALPTVDWNTPLFQRPQHLAIQFAKKINFIFCTYNYKYDSVYGIKKIKRNLIVTNLWKDALRLRPRSWILLLSTQQLITIRQVEDIKSKGGLIIYDYVDEIHEDISGSDSLTQFLVDRHQFVCESQVAELVLCVSKKLYDEMLEYYPKEKVLLVPNGVDYDHFQVKRSRNNISDDFKEIVAIKKPIIGYYGAVANWLDYDLINQTAKSHPEWEFVFIGVDYNGGLAKLNQDLPNIHFLGKKDYHDLPNYGIWFDVALIPFAKGEIAKSTSPLKMYEYMAMRKPIVATEDLVECHGFQGVNISKNDTKSFEAAIKNALKATKDKKILKALDQAARDNTWGERAKKMQSVIERRQK